MRKTFNEKYTMIRSILGAEVFKNKRSGKEYLASYTKTGKAYLKPLKY